MFSPTLTYAYGTCKGQACLIAGYQELEDKTLRALVVMIDGGELILAEMKDVRIDPTKLVKTRNL